MLNSKTFWSKVQILPRCGILRIRTIDIAKDLEKKIVSWIRWVLYRGIVPEKFGGEATEKMEKWAIRKRELFFQEGRSLGYEKKKSKEES